MRKYYEILNFINVYYLHLEYIVYHCYVDSKHYILSDDVITLQEADMYLEDGLYHIHPLHEDQIF